MNGAIVQFRLLLLLARGSPQPLLVEGDTMTTTRKVLLINAHQYVQGIAEGALNKMMVDEMTAFFEGRGCEVQHTTIETGYSIAEEVEKHLWADLVIVQAPVYWFAAPWIYKKYIDEVFTTGYVQQCFLRDDGRTRENPAKQYGSGGLLQGKKSCCP